jgi:hypothetical protein
MASKYANVIPIEQAREEYKELINEALNKNLWFKAKGLNLWLSPYELQDGWMFGKYLYPVKYWNLKNPNDYLRPFAKRLEKSQNIYNYAHKRYEAYIKRLKKTPINN